MRLPNVIATALVPALLDAYARTSLKTGADQVPRLHSILRSYPFWGNGHQRLGEAALESGDVATAYASGQAAKILSYRKPRARARALHLLGRCFLARGEWQMALELLREAGVLSPLDSRIKQDEAAALMLGGEHLAALTVLSTIPEEMLSADGKAARLYLQGKQQSTAGDRQ